LGLSDELQESSIVTRPLKQAEAAHSSIEDMKHNPARAGGYPPRHAAT